MRCFTYPTWWRADLLLDQAWAAAGHAREPWDYYRVGPQERCACGVVGGYEEHRRAVVRRWVLDAGMVEEARFDVWWCILTNWQWSLPELSQAVADLGGAQ